MPNYETLSAKQAERLTGLPLPVIQALAECGEIPAEGKGAELYVSERALLGWCHLFAKVFAAIVGRAPRKQIGSTLSARNLVWMAQAGLLTGKDRIRL